MKVTNFWKLYLAFLRIFQKFMHRKMFLFSPLNLTIFAIFFSFSFIPVPYFLTFFLSICLLSPTASFHILFYTFLHILRLFHSLSLCLILLHVFSNFHMLSQTSTYFFTLSHSFSYILILFFSYFQTF